MKNQTQKTMRKLNIQLTFLILTLFFTVGAAQAATYTVDRTDDATVSFCTAAASDCTLRGAIAAANAASGSDVIEFDANIFSERQIITLTQGLLEIQNNGSLTINGTGAKKLTISGNNRSGVIKISYLAIAEIKNLTVSGGSNSGISNFGGKLTLTGSTVSGNSASVRGGGIYNFKSGSSSDSGRLTIIDSTISGNSATSVINGGGGGIYHESGILTIKNSTISGNTATFGGGIYNRQNLIIINSTISGNSTGIRAFTGTITIKNSIIANSTSGNDCDKIYGTVNASYSLIEDGRCVTNGVNNNLKGDPMLGELADNGGPTLTHALLAGSKAINAGSIALIPTDENNAPFIYDQRGADYLRLVSTSVDIGSFEIQLLDGDSDGINDDIDNCPNDANADQADNDMDMIGDVCDPDDDNDGQSDVDEITCGSDPLDAASKSADNDGDNSPDCVDADDDNDGVDDVNDAFPLDPNESVDTDGDGIGNNADLDDDNDGQSDADEITCGSDPLDAASKSADNDGDNSPDCVDANDDNDGVLDTEDNCPLTFNPDQADFDEDGIGDVCDLQTGPPTRIEQCKNDNYKRFDFPRTFKNQGDCIQFVNTGK